MAEKKVITHARQHSVAQTGRTVMRIQLGIGTWLISHISLAEYTTGSFPDARSAHIGFRHHLGDGTFKAMNLDSGYILSDQMLNFNGPAEVCGPGDIYGVVIHTETTDRSLLVATFRRLSRQCQGP